MSLSLSKTQLRTLCDKAILAAQEAGIWIESFDRDNLRRGYKEAGKSSASQIITEVDIGSEEIIRRHLASVSDQNNIAFVGEESSFTSVSKTRARFEKPYFWCVDPLDGTLPYAEGRAGYTVSIALVEQSGKPLIGVVYDPAKKVLYHGINGQGCYRNFAPFKQRISFSKTLMVYADASLKTHKKYENAVRGLEHCAHNLGLGGIRFVYGSGAVKNACHVIESDQACYLKLPKNEDGGGSIWDYAATACIAHEAGAWATDIHGAALDLNRTDSMFMNHKGILFASNSRIAKRLIDNF